MSLIKEALVALNAGITQYRPGTKEIEWELDGKYITIELIDIKNEKCIIKVYNSKHDTFPFTKIEQTAGKPDGEKIIYYVNGSIETIYIFKEGKLIGFKRHKQSVLDLSNLSNKKEKLEASIHRKKAIKLKTLD